MSDYLTPKEARERLERGEVLEAGIGRLYRAHGNRIEFCDPHGWEESRRPGGIRELAAWVPMRVPAPTLADDLREQIAKLEAVASALERLNGENADFNFYLYCSNFAAGLREILHKHGEAE